MTKRKTKRVKWKKDYRLFLAGGMKLRTLKFTTDLRPAPSLGCCSKVLAPSSFDFGKIVRPRNGGLQEKIGKKQWKEEKVRLHTERVRSVKCPWWTWHRWCDTCRPNRKRTEAPKEPVAKTKKRKRQKRDNRSGLLSAETTSAPEVCAPPAAKSPASDDFPKVSTNSCRQGEHQPPSQGKGPRRTR